MSATYTNKKRKIEKYLEVVRQDGLNTDQNVNIGVTGTPNLWVAGNLSVGGTTSFTSDVITSTSANAFAVGPNGVTNPVFNIDASETSAATGLQVEGQAAGSGVNLETLSSGTNEGMTIDGKGTGTVGINTVSTTSGLVTLGNPTALGGATINGVTKVVVANTFDSWLAGYVGATATMYIRKQASNVEFQSLNAIPLVINDQGNNVTIGSTIGPPVITVVSNGANALKVANSAAGTNPVFNVDASTASQIAGLNLKGDVAGGTVALTTTDSGSNNSLTIAALGTGTVTFNPAIVAAAGGKVSSGIQYGSLNVGLYTGTGAPSFSAMNGSIYTDSNATTTTTRIYVNKSGAGTAGTTWTALTTAA